MWLSSWTVHTWNISTITESFIGLRPQKEEAWLSLLFEGEKRLASWASQAAGAMELIEGVISLPSSPPLPAPLSVSGSLHLVVWNLALSQVPGCE